jgi:hypothetical protein
MTVVRGMCVRVGGYMPEPQVRGGGWDEVLLRCRGLALLNAFDVAGLIAFAGNLRRGKVENRQAFVLEQPRLSLPNR